METLWPIWTTSMQAKEEQVTSYVLFNVEVVVGKATRPILYTLYFYGEKHHAQRLRDGGCQMYGWKCARQAELSDFPNFYYEEL